MERIVPLLVFAAIVAAVVYAIHRYHQGRLAHARAVAAEHGLDRIAAARRFYNTRVEAYNRRTEAFPSNWVARRRSFAKADFFDV